MTTVIITKNALVEALATPQYCRIPQQLVINHQSWHVLIGNSHAVPFHTFKAALDEGLIEEVRNNVWQATGGTA